MNINSITVAALAMLTVGCASPKQTLLVGTATNAESRGIYTLSFDDKSAKTEQLSVAEIESPTFMAYDAESRVVYSVAESDRNSAKVASFSIDTEGKLSSLLSSQPCRSDYPCHIIKGDGFIATANYGGGDIFLYRVSDEVRGEIEPVSQVVKLNKHRAPLSHIHCLVQSPDGRHIFATDLGQDSIYRFAIGEDAVLTQLYPAVAIERGSGPRHMLFAPNGVKAYLISEMSGEVTAFDYNSKVGTLEQFHVVASDEAGGRGSADIHISADGRFLYASNRIIDDGVSTFAIDEVSGELAKIDYTRTGKHPRNFALSPCGAYLLVACRDANAIEIYARDAQTGLLTPMGSEYDIAVDSPMFVKFI